MYTDIEFTYAILHACWISSTYDIHIESWHAICNCIVINCKHSIVLVVFFFKYQFFPCKFEYTARLQMYYFGLYPEKCFLFSDVVRIRILQYIIQT